MTKFLTNRWFHVMLLLGLLAGAVMNSGSDSMWRMRLQSAVFDQYNRLHPRPAPPDRPVVVVDIDEESLKRLGQWPWPRDVVGLIASNLADMGVRATAFDMVFAEPDRTSPQRIIERIPDTNEFAAARSSLAGLPDNDLLMGRMIEKAGNVVTGFTAARPEETMRKPAEAQKILARKDERKLFLEDCFSIRGAATNLPELTKGAAGSGSFIASPEADGIIRTVSLIFSGQPAFGNTLYPSLSLEALRVGSFGKGGFIKVRHREKVGALDTQFLLEIGHYVGDKFEVAHSIPIESDGEFRIHYRHIDRRTEYIPAYKVIDPAFHDEVAPLIKGKIVFVGASPEGLRDVRSTPLNIFIPGVEVHVNALEQILQKDFLLRPGFIRGGEAMAIAGAGLLIILLVPFAGASAMAFVSATFIALAFYGSWRAYTDMGLLLDPVYPSLSIGALFVLSSFLSYVRSEAERRRVRQAFGLYISPDFMKELTDHPDKLKLGGETRELTVMFSDIRNFTTISESLSPAALIQLMNDFLTPMSDLVMNNRGTIDKYMGDAMMAFWNAPLDDADHARHACTAALEMNKALFPINDRLKAQAVAEGRNQVLLKAGIGINTGPASVGNMGSRQRFAYSALGDTVNLASRLEGQTKYYGASVLIGPQTQVHIPDFATLELDLIRVKGKTEPVRVFALLGDPAYATQDFFSPWKAAHGEMLAAWHDGAFERVRDLAARAVDLSGGRLKDFYALYKGRVETLIQNPPAGVWDGVYVAEGK